MDPMDNPNYASDEAFEKLMGSISRVYGLRPGHVLTQEDYDAIQHYDKHNRDDEENAIDAFNRGYQQGLLQGGSADIVKMQARLDENFTKHGVEKAMRMWAERRVDDLQSALKNLLDLPGIGNLPGFMTGAHITAAKALLPASGTPTRSAETTGSVGEADGGPAPTGETPK